MATILVNPQLVSTDATADVVTLQIQVQAADWVGKFNKLQVFRALRAAGPYEELTGPAQSPALLPATGGEAAPAVTGPSVPLTGEQLVLILDEKFTLTVTFTGADPLTFADAAAQITQQGQLKVHSWVDISGQLVIATTNVGNGASLRVLSGAAAILLRLPVLEPASVSRGREARLPLTMGKMQYQFQDLWGSSKCFYKLRFLNSLTSAVSEYSEPFPASNEVGLPTAQLVVGHVTLVGPDGQPREGASVHLHMEYTGAVISGGTVVGGSVEHHTNERGYVEFTLVRGQYYTVSFPGTDLIREIQVPVDASVQRFNLLDPSVVTGQDRFQVVVPFLVSAERRTL